MIRLQFILPIFISTLSFHCSPGSNSLNQQPSSNITQIVSMHEARSSHTATLLADGRVLITGGFKKGADGYSQLYSKTAEIFDPINQTFTVIESMHNERCAHTATLLPNGNVLITGGTNGQKLSSAEIYDIKSGHWQQLPSLKGARESHQAILLQNNKVILIGGSSSPETFAELFNIQSNTFEKLISASLNLEGPIAILLKNGNVLIAGGSMNNEPVQYALIYDSKKNNCTQIENMTAVRHKSAASLLPNGNVIIVAGSNNRDWKGKYKSTEIFDIQNNSFQKGPDLNYERFKLINAVGRTKAGSIFVTGGDKHIEILKPGSSTFESIGELDQPLYYSSATPLNNGTVLITGGYGNNVQSQSKAWIVQLK